MLIQGPQAVLGSPSDRIESLDVMRGFAVPGILMMNIQALIVPPFGYANLIAYGGDSGFNFSL